MTSKYPDKYNSKPVPNDGFCKKIRTSCTAPTGNNERLYNALIAMSLFDQSSYLLGEGTNRPSSLIRRPIAAIFLCPSIHLSTTCVTLAFVRSHYVPSRQNTANFIVNSTPLFLCDRLSKKHGTC